MPRSTAHFGAAILAAFLPAVAALAQQAGPLAVDGRKLEVDAALSVARADLRSQVLAVPVAPNVTIRSLNATKPLIDVDGVLSGAQLVGQPRWIGDDIVQVAMRLPASSFIEKVRVAGLAAGLQKDVMERFARQWEGRSLQGLGQAIPASHVASVVTTLRPTAWASIPDQQRLDAATRARANASGTIVDQASSIPVGPNNSTAAANFTSPDSRSRLVAWADTMPATRVVMTDQREMQLSVYLDKQGLSDVLQAQLSPSITSQSEKTQAIHDKVFSMPDVVVGRASVQLPPTPMPRALVALRQAPSWAGETFTAEGKSASGGSALHAARRAETAAREALRKQIIALKLEDGQTVGEATAKLGDRSVNAAVDQARVYQTQYNPDGSAVVRVTLDGNELLEILATPH